MREEQKKRIQWMQRVLPMYSVLVRPARGKGIFVALNVSDGCWGNYNMRGLRLLCFLSVRAITVSFSFVTAHPAFLSDGIAILKSACSWCDMYPRSFLNIHLEYKLSSL